jgi:hypothetical protein
MTTTPRAAAQLLARCQTLKIALRIEDGRLRCFGRNADLTPELRDKLAAHESELLALLAGGSVIGAAHGDGAQDFAAALDRVAKLATLSVEQPGDGAQDSAAALDPSGWTCPACGSARIAHGLRRLWCLDCETDAGPAANGPQDANEGDAGDWLERIDGDGRRTWQRADFDGLEVIDFPEPCAVCGGVDRWQDLVGGWHCAKCEPRTTGPRLRELARRLRTRYGMTEPDQDAAADAHGQDIHAPERSAPGGSGPAVPDAILRDSPTRCGDCGREVIPGQPGRAAGLCFDCWAKQKGR